MDFYPEIKDITDLVILLCMNIISFWVFAVDKFQAINGFKRVPTFLLLLVALLGGGFGALCAMIFFRHKTRDTAFLVFVPLFACLQIGADIIYRMTDWFV